jgi:hypothetical protein
MPVDPPSIRPARILVTWLSDDGVNWDTLQTYMKRAEGFSAPTSSQAAAGITYDTGCHGVQGPEENCNVHQVISFILSSGKNFPTYALGS